MNDDELARALDALHAYDTGCLDSGIKDEQLRQRVIAELKIGLRPNQLYSDRLSRIVRELYLSDEAIAARYGLETVAKFIDWLEEHM